MCIRDSSSGARIPLDVEETAGILSAIFSTAKDAVERIGIGALEQGVIEVPKGDLFFFNVDGFVLGVLAERGSMMGLVMVKAKGVIKRIKELLQ